jgi:hypothetical protein
MKTSRIMVIMMGLLLTTNILQSQAPNLSGVLFYRQEIENAINLVQLSAQMRNVYSVPLDKCTTTQTSGQLSAQSSEQGTDLIVFPFNTDNVIYRTIWRAEWRPCYIWWDEDDLLISDAVNDTTFYRIDISSNTVTVETPSPYIPAVLPPLPNYHPEVGQDFVLPSPQAGVYLYARCDTLVIPNGIDTVCGALRYAIYDANTQTTIHTFASGTTNQLDTDQLFPQVLWRLAAWSPSGRYLAYRGDAPDSDFQTPFDVGVYDIVTQQTVDFLYPNARIDWAKGMEWSPERDILLVWVTGVLVDSPTATSGTSLSYRTPVFLKIGANSANWYLGAEIDGNVQTAWAPDDSALVYTDLNDNLIYNNTEDASSFILDTNVNRIISWTDPAVMPSPTPTP